MNSETKKERTVIGCTKIADHPQAKVIWYISAMDGNGREDFVGHTPDEEVIRKLWEEMKPDNYDMHLYVSLYKDFDSGDNEIIDDEVIDSYEEEDDDDL